MFVNGMWRLGREVDPLPEIQRLQREMNRLFAGMPRAESQENPAITVWSGEQDYILTSELPGIDPAALEISVLGDMLTFSGSRTFEPLQEGETYHRLSDEVDRDHIAATVKNGVLRVTLRKAEKVKARKIAITEA